MEAGEFVATQLCWPSIRPAAPLPALGETKYVAILSGLQLGGTVMRVLLSSRISYECCAGGKPAQDSNDGTVHHR